MTPNEIEDAIKMKFIGLLTHQQKQAGYFVSQDDDFVYLWRSRPSTDCVAVFIYDFCTIKQVREKAEEDMNNATIKLHH